MQPNLQELATSVVEEVFSEFSPYYDNEILCHSLCLKLIQRQGIKHTLRDWVLLSNNQELKRFKNLKSKSNTQNSIDIQDLYY